MHPSAINLICIVAIPAVVSLLRSWLPTLPKAWLPRVAILLGAGVDLLASSSFGQGTAMGAICGAAAIGLREVVHETKKQITTPLLPLLLCLALLPIVGCARFGTKQTDYSYDPTTGQLIRAITTKAASYTCFESKSKLATWQASQTDKSQTAKVGDLTQEGGPGTNTTKLAEAVATGVVNGLKK